MRRKYPLTSPDFRFDGDRVHCKCPIEYCNHTWPAEAAEQLLTHWHLAVRFNLSIAEIYYMVAAIVPDRTEAEQRELDEVVGGLERDADLMKLRLPPDELLVVMRRQVETLCWLRERFPGRPKVEATILEVMGALGLRARAAREIQNDV
jgi:hypothetical protein